MTRPSLARCSYPLSVAPLPPSVAALPPSVAALPPSVGAARTCGFELETPGRVHLALLDLASHQLLHPLLRPRQKLHLRTAVPGG